MPDYRSYFVVLAFLLAGCQSTPALVSDTAAGYFRVAGWPALPPAFILGNPTGLGLDTSGHLFVFHRARRTWPLVGEMEKTPIADATILMLNSNDGSLVKRWGENLFVMPHGLTIDGSNNVLVTDVGTHQVHKFSHEGQPLASFGEKGIAGNDTKHFDGPTDVCISTDGSFYVSDGYGNNRIVHFSAAGDYLGEWGQKGTGTGEFNIPHSIDIGTNGDVYVADRENKRVQQFDKEGKFMWQWTHESFGRICATSCSPGTNGLIAVDDATSWFNLKHNGSNIIRLDGDGRYLGSFGKDLPGGGRTSWYHDVETDANGNIYVSDILGNALQRFSPLK